MNGEIPEGKNKVLFIAYGYPPFAASGNSRTRALVKYLPARGWLPTVLTVSKDISHWGEGDYHEGIFPGVKVIRTPFPDILTATRDALVQGGILKSAGQGGDTVFSWAPPKGSANPNVSNRVLRWLKRWVSFPDRQLPWFPFCLKAALGEVRHEGYQAIVSTSPPFTAHFIGSALQRLTSIPWVADFRDPWSGNPLSYYTPFQRRVMPTIEKRTLSSASAIVTVSEPLAKDLEKLHGKNVKKIITITNGFDPENYAPEPKLTKKFTITYAGEFYGSRRDPKPLLLAIEELIEEKAVRPEEIVVRLYGPPTPSLYALKESLKHLQILEIGNTLPKWEVIQKEQESTLLFLLEWEEPYLAKGYGGKIFEYLGAKRPVLGWCPSGGIIVDLLEKTGAGMVATNYEELKASLARYIREFQNKGVVEWKGNDEEIEKYSWSNLSLKFAELLESVLPEEQE
ncbi:MAG: glycosyltransferase [Actinomycetota bacterium]|nr:glycosyltransferase [Actinomycetota bacterium]